MPVEGNKETTDDLSSDSNSKSYDVSLCKICVVLLLGAEALNVGII